MSELEQNIPDDFWRKAFEEAAETPPLRVWDAVERRLDEGSKPKILPLWGAGFMSSQPFVWGTGVAAAVALVLLGWWGLHRVPVHESSSVARQQVSAPVKHVAVAPSKPVDTTGPLSKNAPIQTAAGTHQPDNTIALAKQGARSINDQAGTVLAQPAELTAREQAESRPRVALAPVTRQREARTNVPQLSIELSIINAQPEPVLTDQQSPLVSMKSAGRTDLQPGSVSTTTVPVAPGTVARSTAGEQGGDAAMRQAPSFDALTARALRLRSSGTIHRIVWFRPAEPALEPAVAQPKRVAHEAWASLSMMPGAFNPTVAIRSAQASFAKTTALSNSSVGQAAIASRANFSVAYQAGAGVQLNEHWSVESGVGYLAGRSTVDSPVQQTSVYSLQAFTPSASPKDATLYVDALRTSVAKASPAASNVLVSADMNSAATSRYSLQNNYNPQARQTIANDYQFVQVPVQVGYQLRPRKRLGMALIGGFLSNIFVRNTVGDELVVTAKDGVYKPVSLAATMGARFRYRPSKQWSASLAGMYQPSLGFGTRPESVVQSRPTSTGMSFGIDYHF
ncbi:hypothetical protein [Spirosoma rigui]|uniref:hypothetical protein n=1 Tax=Spirosoma rigui TaxID=564064 RepID=UPI0009AF24AD|nr:hypothetical protein [Spirosoma rigui]